MKKTILPAVVLAALFGLPGSVIAREADGPLLDYLAKDDPSYGWVKRREGALGAGSYVELALTSQTWRDTVWKHQLFIIRPSTATADTRHALLFIGGGTSTGGEPAQGSAAAAAGLPAEALLLGRLAELLRTPVAILRQVPRQPLFDGLYEDALIALTFENYLLTGDAEWPLLLPMVKSAVRAMDAVQEYALEAWSQDILGFTVTGASKRGWTAWLAAAADERVTAIAPMVIDMLNLGPQLEHQRAVWGGISPMLRDYTGRGLHAYLGSPAGEALLATVDPYSYRDRLTQPKLIVLGTNDPYWPLDALNLYWDDLPGRNHILYLPNAGHGGMGDVRRVVGSLSALHRHAANGEPLPDLRWAFSEADGRVTLRVESDIAPREVVAWIAESPTRDFRQARWTAHPFRAEGGGGGAYVFDLPVPEAGHAALFGEAVYDGRGDAAIPYFLSTNVRIIGQAGQG